MLFFQLLPVCTYRRLNNLLYTICCHWNDQETKENIWNRKLLAEMIIMSSILVRGYLLVLQEHNIILSIYRGSIVVSSYVYTLYICLIPSLSNYPFQYSEQLAT